MTAGRGIVQSERSPDTVRASGGPLYGLQTWVALPTAHEETDPGFFHHGADAIPSRRPMASRSPSSRAAATA